MQFTSYSPEQLQKLDINVREILKARHQTTGEPLADLTIRTAEHAARAQATARGSCSDLAVATAENEALRMTIHHLAQRLENVVEPAHARPAEGAHDFFLRSVMSECTVGAVLAPDSRF